MKKLLSLALALTLGASTFTSSADDFGTWFSVGVKKKLPAGLTIGAEGEFRQQAGEAERYTIGLQASYSPLRSLKVDAGYRYLRVHTLDYMTTNSTGEPRWIENYWTNRNRLYASITGSVNVWKLKLSLRERFQYTHRHGTTTVKYKDAAMTQPTKNSEKVVATKDKSLLRSRVQAEFKISKKCPFEPFISAELSSNLKNDMAQEKMRYEVGTEFRLNRHSQFELFYVYQNVRDFDDPNTNSIGIGYTYSF